MDVRHVLEILRRDFRLCDQRLLNLYRLLLFRLLAALGIPNQQRVIGVV